MRLSGKFFFCSFVEAFGDTVRGCLAFACVAGPSGCVEPFCAVSGSVDVDADEDDVGFAEGIAVGVVAVAGVEEDKKTKPDSLTNQGLPGLNIANLCRFFITNKFLLVFYFSNASI